jgi:NAD(P)-dependent dehydrogenase (short-subunit alcohol dehydrogenase family)
MRLKDRVAIVVGAGQSPGEGMGNGRATALACCAWITISSRPRRRST